MIEYLVFFLCLYLLLQLWQLYWLSAKRKASAHPQNWPSASVLLAARNEADNIERCLQALIEVDYPQLEIIVGNDRSEDDTAKIVQRFATANNEYDIKLVEIEGKYPQTMAKAAVLAELAHHSKADIYLITDADIAVPKTWAKELISHYEDPKVGIVSGTTYIEGKGIWGSLQSIDWLYFMCLVETFHRAGVKTTAIGNNMSIRSKAYWETGGYENIPFSITEDYKIYQNATKLGWEARNICNQRVLAIGNPIKGWRNLLHQRKRWLMGAKELPSNWWVLFIIFSFYYPISLVLFFVAPQIALLILGIKFVLQFSYIMISAKKLKLQLWHKIAYFFLYEPYLYTVTITTLLFFLLPMKTEWKGRRF
jgi:cellulose synthase/poly-beta-1,6-N-acetylglucosamine synthase-like glycosyltransferase